MRFLILGGTHHVGRAFVETLLAVRRPRSPPLTSGRKRARPAGVRRRPVRRPVRHRRRSPRLLGCGHVGRGRRHLVGRSRGRQHAGARLARRSGRRTTPTSPPGRSTAGRSRPVPTSRRPLVDADPTSIDDGRLRRGQAWRGAGRRSSSRGPVLLARAGLILGPWERGRPAPVLAAPDALPVVGCPRPALPTDRSSTSTLATSRSGCARRGCRSRRRVQHRQPARGTRRSVRCSTVARGHRRPGRAGLDGRRRPW